MDNLSKGALGTCLVTGGTGTFGRAFARRVLDDGLVERLIVYSRDEYKQARMEAEFQSDPRLRFYLGDVRDRDQLRRAFSGVDTVVHCAALKRVDRSALDVMEFIKTNVLGTMNVIEAAHDRNVGRVVVLSTDKAVESVTPYGACKAIAEWLAIAGNVYGDTHICAVRYGNIMNSRGSVLEAWQRQHDADEPLTVTDDHMTRFWLRIEQAVDLVLLALDRMGGGEIFIPKDVDRGRVIDFALRYFPDAEFVETGKRSYEKIAEVLVAAEETDRLVDCGDCYVLQPMHVRWEPGPYGVTCGSPVGEDFQYRSDSE